MSVFHRTVFSVDTVVPLSQSAAQSRCTPSRLTSPPRASEAGADLVDLVHRNTMPFCSQTSIAEAVDGFVIQQLGRLFA